MNERVQDVFHDASAAATAAIAAAVNAAESAAEHAVQVAVDVVEDTVEGIEEAIEDFEEVAEQLIDGLIDMIWPKDCGDGPLDPAQRGGRSWSRGDAPCGSTTVPHISSTHSTLFDGSHQCAYGGSVTSSFRVVDSKKELVASVALVRHEHVPGSAGHAFVVAFRGTDTTYNWLQNANAIVAFATCPLADSNLVFGIHAGFCATYMGGADMIADRLRDLMERHRHAGSADWPL